MSLLKRCINVVTWVGESDAKHAARKLGLVSKRCEPCKGWHVKEPKTPHERAKAGKR